MGAVAVNFLKVLLVVAMGGVLLVQLVVLPEQAAWMASQAPELAHLRYPVLTIAALGLVPAQVVVVCLWRLLTMVRDDTVFSPAAFRWVDVVIASGIVAAVVAAGLNVGLVAAGAGQPGVMLMLGFATAVGAGVALLVYVLRLLLQRAVALDAETTALHAELDGVV
ncbi:DUF2975 domain-containing protein [Xylanimonas oleitrophica]|uniref:DUF2975 domain-containing protein n=1 Tax=Xylanimonas oleitrophica TaxID=2607479 RepID=A0A2W5WVW4_9MICO|nr:DUF2975 domain-containing protein [Xylanimonas oleitrophica]PZR55310.1 DUF2975 domain-containing protein [Xylanimonas oleitrophica]